MHRTASHSNSLGTINVAFEGFGSLKHLMGNDEFGGWLDHQADKAGELLPESLSDLVPSPLGDKESEVSFTVIHDSTTVKVTISVSLRKNASFATIDAVLERLSIMLKTHLRIHLNEDELATDPSDLLGDLAGILPDFLLEVMAGDRLGDPDILGRFYQEFLGDQVNDRRRTAPRRSDFTSAGRR